MRARDGPGPRPRCDPPGPPRPPAEKGWFGLEFDDATATFRLGDARGEHVVEVGLDDWTEGDTTMTGAKLHHGYEPASLRVVVGGRWTGTDAFEMTWQFVETSFRDTVVVRFEDDDAVLERSDNVNTFPTVRPAIGGRHQQEYDRMTHPALLALALTAQAAPATDPAPLTYSTTTTTTTIGELLDTPATKAVLEADVPSVVHNLRIDEGSPYTLSDIVQYAPELTPQVLAKLDADLARVKRAPAPAKP